MSTMNKESNVACAVRAAGDGARAITNLQTRKLTLSESRNSLETMMLEAPQLAAEWLGEPFEAMKLSL